MSHAGEKAKKFLDGASTYATPWNLTKGHRFFYDSFHGLFQRAIGLNLNRIVRSNQLEPLKQHCSEEDAAHYDWAINTNKTGLDRFDQEVYPRMWGYKDAMDYYEKCSLDLIFMNIKVPTLSFESRDDILADYNVIPLTKIASDESNVLVAVTKSGAHACHLSGSLKPKNWYQEPILEFFNFLRSKQT